MYAAQPDLWDFANRTMYEITTAGQAGFKSGNTGKLAAQIKLANDITGVAECGGLMFSPGGWAPSPSPCCLLPSGLYISTVNVGGVLVYTPLKGYDEESWRWRRCWRCWLPQPRKEAPPQQLRR